MVLVVLAALVAAYLITPHQSRYQSETILLVGKAPTELDDDVTNQGQRLTGLSLVALTYVQMITSRPVAEEAVREFGFDTSPSDLQSSVTAIGGTGTQLIYVRVTDDDPQTAKAMADGIVQAFINVLEDQSEQQQSSEISDSPGELAPVSVFAPGTLPTTPQDNGLLQNLLLGLLFGVFVAVGVVLVLEYVDLTLRMPEDVERHTGLPVLGVIPVANELSNRSLIIGTAARIIESRSMR